MFKTIATAALAITLTATIATAGTLWGVSHSTNDYWNGWYQGGQIWTMDTETNVITVRAEYDQIDFNSTGEAWDDGQAAFGDIAVNANGEVYVTIGDYNDEVGFKTLAKVNTGDWSLQPILQLGSQVNALQFIDGTLYGITGGGIDSRWLEIPTDGTAETDFGLVGVMGINSDGDIALAPDGTVYATFWDGRSNKPAGSGPGAFDEILFDGSTVSTVQGPWFSGMVNSLGQNNAGVAGFTFVGDTLYAGSYYDTTIFTVDPTTGAATPLQTSGDQIGTIVGLSNQVPEPMTLLAVGSAVAGLGGYIRRRKQA